MKLSIITINRNNAAGLARTLKSTFGAQPGFDDWEQIVVDGASTDDSLEVLDQWKDDTHLGWHVSEPDTGIYNAMNKGASHARGDYLLFLNSGDMLLNDSLREVFSRPINADLVISNMVINYGGHDRPYFSAKPFKFDPVFFLFRVIPHQGTLISRELHKTIGGYDENLRFAADHKFFFQCFTDGTPSVLWLEMPFSRFYTDGMSYQYKNRKIIHDEWESMLVPYFGKEIAHRAGIPMEGRPWIRDDIAVQARRDAGLARFLFLTTRASAFLWKFRPMRFAIKRVDKIGVCIRRVLRGCPATNTHS